MSTAKESTERLLRELRRQARRRRGEIREIETKKLSRSPGYVSRVTSGRRGCSAHEYFAIVEALGLDVAEHVGMALGSLPNPLRWLEELEETHPKEQLITSLVKARRARRRFDKLDGWPRDRLSDSGSTLEVESLLELSPADHRSLFRSGEGWPDPALLDAYLAHLDDLRYRCPREAGELAETVVLGLCRAPCCDRDEWRGLYCRSLGVLGSAFRQQGRLRVANRAFQEALFCAQLWHRKRREADLLRRTSCLLTDYGELEKARQVSAQAFSIYLRPPCQLGIARVMVDQGILQNLLGDPEKAIHCFSVSLRSLPSNDVRHKAAAHLGMGRALYLQGRLEEAAEAYDRAARLVPTEETTSLAHITLRRGDVAYARKDFSEAERLYRKCCNLVTDGSPYDLALASLQRIKALLALGRRAESVSIATEMLALLSPLRYNKVAASAISDFVRVAREGRLTKETVSETQERIERGRATKNGSSTSSPRG